MLRIIAQNGRQVRIAPTHSPIRRQFFSTSTLLRNQTLEGLVVGMYEGGKLTSYGETLNQKTQGQLKKQLQLAKNEGKGDAKTLLFGLPEADRVAVVGLGKDNGKPYEVQDSVRKAAAHGTLMLKSSGAQKIAFESFDGNVQSAAEGATLALWKYDMKTKKDEEKNFPQIFPVDSSQQAAWTKGTIIAEAQNFARTLAETPSNYMTPSIFGQKVSEQMSKITGEKKVVVNIRTKEWIVEKKMGCFLGVTQGSVEPPVFLELHYKGGSESADSQPLVLVGKGVTFDTGGISIKPSAGMADMKGDMGGGASVVSAIYGIAQLGLKVNVIGLVPLCENMPSGNAIKPGDVLVAMNGKTVEVDNTDAEGRLLLADALHYAHSFNPHTIIDVATLTGAIDVALGSGAYGTFTNNEELWNQIYNSSLATSEFAWRMPLHFPQYKSAMKASAVADLINASKTRSGGSCTAAAFLEEFVTHNRWAHLDIAGVSQSKEARGYLRKGMTGIPTRTFIDIAKNFEK